MANKEAIAMRTCTSEVIDHLAAIDPKEVADKLYSADLLPKSTYDEISSSNRQIHSSNLIV